MNKIEMSKNPDYCFAALKLIEQLYKDGKIPNFMYRNMPTLLMLRLSSSEIQIKRRKQQHDQF